MDIFQSASQRWHPVTSIVLEWTEIQWRWSIFNQQNEGAAVLRLQVGNKPFTCCTYSGLVAASTNPWGWRTGDWMKQQTKNHFVMPWKIGNNFRLPYLISVMLRFPCPIRKSMKLGPCPRFDPVDPLLLPEELPNSRTSTKHSTSKCIWGSRGWDTNLEFEEIS